MTKYAPIPLGAHAFFDVALVAIGLSGPFVLGFSNQFWPAAYTIGASLFGFALNAITDYPIGLWRKLPFAAHRLIEWTAPLPFVVVPWMYFADAGPMPWLMSAIGVAIFLNAAFTQARKPVAA